MKKNALKLFTVSNNSFCRLINVYLVGINWMLKIYYKNHILALDLEIVYPKNGISVYLSIKHI
jgi:hypothetical protein